MAVCRYRYPIIRPTVPEIDELAVEFKDILASGIITVGPRVAELEKMVAKRLGVADCVAVSSCTSGLILAANLAASCRALGEPRRAIEAAEQYLALAREAGDRKGEAGALATLGHAWLALGEHDRAIELFEQHLALARTTEGLSPTAANLGALGNAYYAAGSPRPALEAWERQLAVAQEAGDRRAAGNALFNMGLALHLLGNVPEAVARARSALETLKSIGDPNAAKVAAELYKWDAQKQRN